MNKFFENSSCVYRAEVSRPPYPVDSFHLLITSQWLGAKNPVERRRQLDITLSRDELTKLGDVIAVHLAKFKPIEVEGVPV